MTAHAVPCLGFRATTPLEYQDADGVRTTMEWRMTRQCVRLLAVVLVVTTPMLPFVLMATFPA